MMKPALGSGMERKDSVKRYEGYRTELRTDGTGRRKG